MVTEVGVEVRDSNTSNNIVTLILLLLLKDLPEKRKSQPSESKR